jgi:hypothetical protein
MEIIAWQSPPRKEVKRDKNLIAQGEKNGNYRND